MSQLLFYISAIVVGILLHLAVSSLARFFRNKKNNTVVSNVSISEDHIQDCILPNNRGKSIDSIAAKLISNQIDPDFSVDFSKQNGDET